MTTVVGARPGSQARRAFSVSSLTQAIFLYRLYSHWSSGRSQTLLRRRLDVLCSVVTRFSGRNRDAAAPSNWLAVLWVWTTSKDFSEGNGPF